MEETMELDQQENDEDDYDDARVQNKFAPTNRGKLQATAVTVGKNFNCNRYAIGIHYTYIRQ